VNWNDTRNTDLIPSTRGVIMPSKTSFTDKCEILSQVWVNWKDEEDSSEGWKSLFRMNDVGFPFAYLVRNGYASVKKSIAGENPIEETWQDFCHSLSIDPEAKYSDIIDMFKVSPIYADTDFSAWEEEYEEY
jgi:hypothetical protein